MNPHLQYLLYLLKHKWFVFIAGRKTKAPLWRLIIHDWTKFTPAEWPAYVRRFFGPHSTFINTQKVIHPEGLCPRCDEAVHIKREFKTAWKHHWQNNPHHWEYWQGAMMPYPYVREMVADWAGAGRAITGKWDVGNWYEQNKDKIELSPNTRRYAEALLRKHFA